MMFSVFHGSSSRIVVAKFPSNDSNSHKTTTNNQQRRFIFIHSSHRPIHQSISTMILGRSLVIASLIATTSLAQNLRQGDAAEHRALAGSPTKSPSTGLHKPTWKPSSKPAEHRELKTEEKSDRGPPHVATPTMKPKTSKPVEHRKLSSTSKPNEKGKTSKPAEKKSSIGAALPRAM